MKLQATKLWDFIICGRLTSPIQPMIKKQQKETKPKATEKEILILNKI